MTPLILGALWVVAASITAMLPMRAQMIPGLSLLLAAPLLLIWIYRTQGVFWTAAGTFALLSMFRRPLTTAFAPWARVGMHRRASMASCANQRPRDATRRY